MRRVLIVLGGMTLALVAASGCTAIVGFTATFTVDGGVEVASVDATSPDAAPPPTPAGALACASTLDGGWQLDCDFGTFATAELGTSRTPPSLAAVTGVAPPLYAVGTGAVAPSMFVASIGADGLVTPIFSDDAGDGVNVGCVSTPVGVYMATLEDVPVGTTSQVRVQEFVVPSLAGAVTLDAGSGTPHAGLVILTSSVQASKLFVLGNVQSPDASPGVVTPAIDVATFSGSGTETITASAYPIPASGGDGGSEPANCGTAVHDGYWIGARGADDSGAALHVDDSMNAGTLLHFSNYFDGMISLVNGSQALAVSRLASGDGLAFQLLETVDAGDDAASPQIVPVPASAMPDSVTMWASADTVQAPLPRQGELLVAGANAAGVLTVLAFDFQGDGQLVPHTGFGDAGVLVLPLRQVTEAGAPLSGAAPVAAAVGGVVLAGDEIYVSLLLEDPAAGARAVIVGISPQ